MCKYQYILAGTNVEKRYDFCLADRCITDVYEDDTDKKKRLSVSNPYGINYLPLSTR